MENSIPLIDSLFKRPSTNGSAEPVKPEELKETPEQAAISGIWKQYGFHQSKNHNANPIALDVELHKLLEQYKKTIHLDEQGQEQMKAPLKAKIATLAVDIQ